MNGTDRPTGSPQATASGTPKRPHDASSPAATRTPPPADNLATARDATALPAGDQDRLPGALVPDWPAPASIRSLVTTRLGGVGTGAYASFNLGLRAGDDPAAVAANRGRLRAHLPAEPVWLHQVHGASVVEAMRVPAGEEPRADAAWTSEPGVVCAVLVADCMPVLMCSADGQRVGVAHAGWRGLSAGVIERTLEAMELSPDRTLAWLGPAIGPAAFEVGADVLEAFAAPHPEDASAFAAREDRPGKWHADLFELARRRLARLGVTQVHGGGLCTWSDPARFFSYRRDRAPGRMAAVAWIAP